MKISVLQSYLKAEGVEDLWQLHCAAMAERGFDRLFYAYSCFRTANLFGNPEDALILTNHPSDYIERFVNEGLFREGPMMKWAARNVGTISWREVIPQMNDRELTEGEKIVLSLNKGMGMVAGYTISFPMALKHASAGIGLTAAPGLSQDDADAIWARDGAEIEVLNHVAHLCITQLPATGQSRALTARQRQVLEMVADGKTMQDVAILLERNTATVEKHLRGARDALQVETTAQAVRKASMLNQIFLIEPQGARAR